MAAFDKTSHFVLEELDFICIETSLIFSTHLGIRSINLRFLYQLLSLFTTPHTMAKPLDVSSTAGTWATASVAIIVLFGVIGP